MYIDQKKQPADRQTNGHNQSMSLPHSCAHEVITYILSSVSLLLDRLLLGEEGRTLSTSEGTERQHTVTYT